MRSFIIYALKPDIVREIKSRRTKMVGYLASMKEIENAYEMLVGNTKVQTPVWRSNCRVSE
jgi:hypothetical protein